MQAQAAFITNQELTIKPAQSGLASGPLAELFFLLSPGVLNIEGPSIGFFDQSLTVLGFSTTSVSNRVSASDTVGMDGSVTRTFSDIRDTTTREILGFSILNLIGLDSFGSERVSFQPGALFIDFTDISIGANSQIDLEILFESKTTSQVVSEFSEVIDASMVALNTISVREPSSQFMVLFLVIFLFGRVFFIKNRISDGSISETGAHN